ncbi:MAG: anti-sigma factor [Acidimicrobiia bacterium]
MSDELHALAPGFALDALDELEQARFIKHLTECLPCQDEVAAIQEKLVPLALAVEEAPPAHIRDRVLAAVDTAPQETPRRPKNTRLSWLLAAAAIAVLSVFGATLWGRGGLVDSVLGDPAALTFEAMATEAGTGVFDTASVIYSEQYAAAVLVIDGLASVGMERTYEMWLVGDTGPIPAGTFRPAPDGNASVEIEGELTDGLVFAVTEELAGGVPSPTGEILLTARIDT